MMKSNLRKLGLIAVPMLLAFLLISATASSALAKIVKCSTPSTVCPQRICAEYDKDVMKVGETQRIVLTGGIAPYGHSFDQGWQTIDLKLMPVTDFSSPRSGEAGAREAPACRSSFSSTTAVALPDALNSR